MLLRRLGVPGCVVVPPLPVQRLGEERLLITVGATRLEDREPA